MEIMLAFIEAYCVPRTVRSQFTWIPLLILTPTQQDGYYYAHFTNGENANTAQVHTAGKW